MTNATPFRVPHTLVLLFAMTAIALVLTWVLPAGTFDTAPDESGRQVVVAGTYHTLDDAEKLSPLALLTVIPRALGDAQAIIFFVLLIGGVLAVVRSTGAIDASLGWVLGRFGHRVGLLMFGGLFIFGVASSTFGMAVEYIALVGIMVSLCVALRLDTLAAVSTMIIGYGIGYGAAAINPFTVMVAQNVAGLEPGSGMWLRLVIFLPFLLIGFHHVYRYALRVQADPTASYVYDLPDAQPPKPAEYPVISHRHLGVLAAMLTTLVLLIVGVVVWRWSLTELVALFLGLAIVSAVVGGLSADNTARSFGMGAAELSMTALLIGFARAIALMLEDGQVLHTIVHYLSMPLSMVGAHFAAVGMLIIQSILNLFIPSGSGQAYVTMPLMSPLSDLLGIPRQVAVLAYQFGDGFMNIIVPTNAVLMGILGVANIPYDRWFRFIWPLVLKLMAASALVLVFAVAIGYS